MMAAKTTKKIQKSSLKQLSKDYCNNDLYIHDLDFASIPHNCTLIPVNSITDYLGESTGIPIGKVYTPITSSCGTGKSQVLMTDILKSGLDFDGDVIVMNHPVISNIKIMNDIVSMRFSDSTIVIISRNDYEENALFLEDFSKDDIIREFAIEVY